MMIDPPIDKLIQKTVCRYALVAAISQRARQLALETEREYLEKSGLSPISLAAKEIYEGKTKIIL